MRRRGLFSVSLTNSFLFCFVYILFDRGSHALVSSLYTINVLAGHLADTQGEMEIVKRS